METSTVVGVVVAGVAAAAAAVALTMLRTERGRMRAERHAREQQAADTARELGARIATAATALDSLSDGVVVFGPEGRVLLSNPAAHTQ